jgi:catechol 2,3-dioxygenase-like lactoylglutathione lyase family enzyme
MNIFAVASITLVTGDLEKCVHFYKDILGLTMRKKNGCIVFNAGFQKIRVLTNPLDDLPTCHYPHPGSLDFTILSHDSIVEVVKKMKERNAPLLPGVEGEKVEEGYNNYIYLRDPDGNLIRIVCCNDKPV